MELVEPLGGPDVLEDGGEMGALMRAYDWASTPLGRPARWPQSLRTTVGIMLRSPVPMVLLWGPDGIMIYNDAYSVFAGGRHPRLLGSKVLEGWPEVADFNANVMRVGLAGGTLSYRDQELTLHRNGVPEQVWMNLDYSPVPDETGRPGGVLAIVVETTQRVLAERRLAKERERLQQLFQQAPGFMAMLSGPDHVFEIVNASYRQLVGHGRDIVGLPVRQALPDIEGQVFFGLLDQVHRTGQAYVGRSMAVSLQRTPDTEPEQRFVDFVYQPITDAAGTVTGIFAEGYDVTERVRSEEQQRLLLRELNHRVKNLFAIVGGIVSLSARTAGDPKVMAVDIRARLDALARANDLIRPGLMGPTEAMTGATDLERLADTVLRPWLDAGTDRVSLSGPHIALGGHALTSIALVLHETATNAAKYGALSAPGGRVDLVWRTEGETLLLVWSETGGPPVARAAEQTGFGSLLVGRSIEGQLGGSIRRNWLPDGLRIEIALPLAAIRD